MKKYITILVVCFTISLFSCNTGKESDESNGAETDLTDAISKAEGRRAADPDASGGNTCLLGYQDKYDQLLTEEMVLSATGFSKDKMDIKYSKALKNPEYHSIDYRFANKRIGSPIGTDFKLPLNDNIALKSITPVSLSQFKNSYRVLSQQETAESDKMIDDALSGESISDEANEKAKELEKSGVSKKTIEGAGNTMKKAFAKVSESYENVEGLADAATWNTFSQELNVFQNGVKFEIFANISNETAINKKAAIEVARKILEKCK